MKTKRHPLGASAIALIVAASFFGACEHDQVSESVSDGSWNAAFRISAGNLTQAQMEAATWVRVEASRSGNIVASAEAGYDVGRVTLTIPDPGGVDISLIGFASPEKKAVMWSGFGRVENGQTRPILTLVEGPDMVVADVPRFSLESGTYYSTVNVRITSSTLGAEIYYTTDGTTPTTLSRKYNSLVLVDTTLILKAIAWNTGMARSEVCSANYSIDRNVFGTVKDSRDGNVYKIVGIGNQTWMAQNLNYKVDSSWCYKENADSCSKYGRIYNWAAAMALPDSCGVVSCSTLVRPEHQGVCPAGWHVPSDLEWGTLVANVGSRAGQKLKSTSGWVDLPNYSIEIGPDTRGRDGLPTDQGLDIYGFNILPASSRTIWGYITTPGEATNYLIASEYSADKSITRFLHSTYDTIARRQTDKAVGSSVRCLKDRS